MTKNKFSEVVKHKMFKKLKDKTREAAEAAQATLTRSDSMSSLNSQNSQMSGFSATSSTTPNRGKTPGIRTQLNSNAETRIRQLEAKLAGYFLIQRHIMS